MKSLKYIAILLLIFTAELAATILPPTSRGAYSSGRRLIGQTITFTGSGSFDNDSQTGEYGPIWLWDFEYDGTNFSGDIQTGSMTVTHVYNTPGVYKVGVQYRDDDEQWGSVYTFTITINRIDRYYYVKDHLGSVRQTVNGSGAIVAAQDYYPYGELLRSYNNSLANEKYKFTEKEQDVETGFLYFGKRYYDGKLGIWLQIDPKSEEYSDVSPYNYCANSPLFFIDPTGENWFYYQSAWHWHEGEVATYTDQNGDEQTIISYMEMLVVYVITGKNEEGAETGNVTLYNQNEIVAYSEGVFSGGRGFSPAKEGNYEMDLGNRTNPQLITYNGDVTLRETFGIQYFPKGVLKYKLSGYKNEYWDVGQEWGNGRIRLNYSGERNLYFHGKHSEKNYTHGCVCDKSEVVYNYLNKSGYSGIVPFNITK